MYDYLNSLNYFFQFKLVFTEELIVIFMFYNFLKLIIFGSIVELIWPTQFFNKKHSSMYLSVRYRTFIETLIKLRPNISTYKAFNKSMLYHMFIKYAFKK